MTVNMIPEFKFEGSKWNFITRYLAEKRWLGFYNQFVEATNPHIAEWNKAWDSIHGDVDLSKDTDLMAKYNEFMADKMTAIASGIGDKIFGVSANKEEACFQLVLKKFPECIMDISWRLVE